MERLEPAARALAAPVTTYGVTITMSQATVDALTKSGYLLYALKAVASSDKAGVPVVWLRSAYGLTTNVEWCEQYQAYTSPQSLSPTTPITAAASYPIAVGQTLEVRTPAGTGAVVGGGVADAIAILDRTTTAFACGPALPCNGAPTSPICAFPLYGNNVQVFGPVLRVLLLFSTTDAPPGLPVRTAWGPGILIDFESADTRQVTFDLNDAWGWDGGAWAKTVDALDDVVPLLMLPLPPSVERAARDHWQSYATKENNDDETRC